MQITFLRSFLNIQDYVSAEAPSFQWFEIGAWLALVTAGLGDPQTIATPEIPVNEDKAIPAA